MAIQIELIKLTNWRKKLAPNTTLRLNVTERLKGTALNVNHRFIYILFLFPLNLKNKRSTDKSSETRTIWQKRTLTTSYEWKSLFHSFCCWTGNWWKSHTITFSWLWKQKRKKSRRKLFRKSLGKKLKEGDIIPATSISQEENIPLQASFIDEILDINMEDRNKQCSLFMNQWKLYL